jgi:hypothetical protein
LAVQSNHTRREAGELSYWQESGSRNIKETKAEDLADKRWLPRRDGADGAIPQQPKRRFQQNNRVYPLLLPINPVKRLSGHRAREILAGLQCGGMT